MRLLAGLSEHGGVREGDALTYVDGLRWPFHTIPRPTFFTGPGGSSTYIDRMRWPIDNIGSGHELITGPGKDPLPT